MRREVERKKKIGGGEGKDKEMRDSDAKLTVNTTYT